MELQVWQFGILSKTNGLSMDQMANQDLGVRERERWKVS
jgi:hypothetical protein